VKSPPESADPFASSPLCVIGEADLFIARLLRRYATTYGLRTQSAQTGEDVLAWVHPQAEARPALVILDPELPGKVRGWEVAQRLQGGGEPVDAQAVIPLILCSWLGESQAQALAGQAVPHLQKPDLHYEDFIAALEKVGLLRSAEDNRHYGGSE